MNTFSAFRTVVISVSLSHSRHARYISATSSVFAGGAPAPPKARFNKNTFLASQGSGAGEQQKERRPTGPLKDEDIKYRTVQITHDGRLSSLTTVKHILSLIDRRGYYIQLVNHRPPVVKIVSKADDYSRKRQEHEQAKHVKATRAHKEVQLSWAAGEADATHKLEKIREDLAKGSRVDLVFEQKKGQPSPSPQEMHERVQAVVDSLADVGKEWKDRRIQRRLAAVFLQGTKQLESEMDAEKLGDGSQKAVIAAEKMRKKEEEKKRRAERKKEKTILEGGAVASDEPSKTLKKKYQVDPIPQQVWDLFG
ncbi:hypothetical protein AX15_003374 [Amanita polypyramis BW_CC]|nr:hypothetical protein AX15_003374 [Amanita polypyramis BW_CC]